MTDEVDAAYVEARAAMPDRLVAMLEKSKADCIARVHKRDALSFTLAWHPGDEFNELTDVQARAIWRKFGYEQGSRITLEPAPHHGIEIWHLHCCSSERTVFNEELMALLFPEV